MEEALLQRRFMELARRAYDSGRYTYTHFLNLMELDSFARMKNSLGGIPYTLWGGAEGCERKLIRFGDEALCGYAEDMPLACVHVAPINAKFADDLTHRDFLGASMNLGIERDAIGDIRVMEDVGYIFCLSSIAPFLVENLDRVKRTGVRCKIVEESPEAAAPRMEEAHVQVASVRLDAVAARIYGLSRGNMQELCRAGRVFINDRQLTSGSYLLKENDVVSVRGYGRFRYLQVVGITKRGRYTASVEKYV